MLLVHTGGFRVTPTGQVVLDASVKHGSTQIMQDLLSHGAEACVASEEVRAQGVSFSQCMCARTCSQ